MEKSPKPLSVEALVERLRDVAPESAFDLDPVVHKHWRKARSFLRKTEEVVFQVVKDDAGTVVSLLRKPPGPVKLLMEYLRTVEPGKSVSWEDMSIAIEAQVTGKSNTWKMARRRLEEGENVWFLVVDGYGLRRTHRPVVRRAVKVELKPRKSQLSALKQNLGYARRVKRWALDHHEETGQPIGGKRGAQGRKEYVERRKKGEDVTRLPRTSAKELRAQWTRTKNEDPELAWVDDMIGSVSTYAIEQVETAYKNAYDRMAKGATGRNIGWPRFPRKGDRGSFTLQDQSFRLTRRAIKLGKIGMVPIARNRTTRKSSRPHQFDRIPNVEWKWEKLKSKKKRKKQRSKRWPRTDIVLVGRPPKNMVKRLVVEHRANRWWCTIMFEFEDNTEPLPKTGRVAGVDLGHRITVYDGTDDPPSWDPPRPLEKYLRWKRVWARVMSRRYQEGKPAHEQSKRWWKAKRILQALDFRIACIRKDWCEQVSHKLTLMYDEICIEGFDVRRFVSEAVEYRKQRRRILDIGWGMLRLAIERKAIARGRTFTKLGEFDKTDQTCNKCGATHVRKDGVYRCTKCGNVELRPHNTAQLLYKHITGQGPEGFPGETQGTPVGEAGVNTRGSGVAGLGQSRAKRRHDESRGRGSEPRDAGRPRLDRGRIFPARDTEPITPLGADVQRALFEDTISSTSNGQKRGKARKTSNSSRRRGRASARPANPPDRGEAAE